MKRLLTLARTNSPLFAAAIRKEAISLVNMSNMFIPTRIDLNCYISSFKFKNASQIYIESQSGQNSDPVEENDPTGVTVGDNTVGDNTVGDNTVDDNPDTNRTPTTTESTTKAATTTTTMKSTPKPTPAVPSG